jgi:alanine dehydrogenase
MPLLLNRDDVRSILTIKDAIEAVEEGFRQLALGNVLQPQRTAIRMAAHHGLHLGMPAFIGGDEEAGGALALKAVTVYPDNPARYNLPTTIGTLLLHDPRTGALLAIMDAGYLTAMRTGAVSGVATKHLAPEDAHTLGIFGAGIMAMTQLQAVIEVRGIDRATVYDTNRERAAQFVIDAMKRLSIDIEIAESPRACVENEIICAATSSREPIFDGSWLFPGTHLNGVGSHAPDARELDTETLLRSKVIVDHLPACLAEAGDLILPMKEGAFTEDWIHASLGEVVAGQKPGRETAEEITLFKSVGLAVQDAATAARVYERARAAGIGQEIVI